MIKSISSALAAIAVVTFASLTGQASAQHCSSCASPAATGNFTYPAAVAGCGQGGCGSRHGHGKLSAHFQELKGQLQHTAKYNSKIAARNDAWPLPFSCADKRDYYHVWHVMLSSGAETHAVLDSNYFTDDNALNGVGIDRVAGIVLNNPSNERTVYVNRSSDESTNQARVNAIRNTVATYYSHVAGVDVRLSDKRPQSVSGTSIEQLQKLRVPALPPAVIPVSPAGSVSGAVSQ